MMYTVQTVRTKSGSRSKVHLLNKFVVGAPGWYAPKGEPEEVALTMCGEILYDAQFKIAECVAVQQVYRRRRLTPSYGISCRTCGLVNNLLRVSVEVTDEMVANLHPTKRVPANGGTESSAVQSPTGGSIPPGGFLCAKTNCHRPAVEHDGAWAFGHEFQAYLNDGIRSAVGY